MNFPMTKLAEITEKIGSGVTPRGGDSVYVSEGTPLIRSQNVYNSQFDQSGLVFVDKKTAQKMKGVTVLADDVLLNITGDSVARCCKADERFLPARVNQHVAIIRPMKDKLNPDFLMFYLTSPYMQTKMLSWAGSGGTRKALTKGMIEGFEVPTPDIGVQAEISEILKNYNDLIENNKRRIELLEESARQLYKEWFVRFRFPGNEHVKIIDGVPEGWEPCKVSDLLTLQRGFDLPVNNRIDGNVPIYASTGLNGYHNVHKVKAPGLVTGRSGSLGKVTFISKDFWPLNTTLWAKEFKKVNVFYALYLLRELKLENYNGGAAVPTLNRNDVHGIETLLPPSSLLASFSEYVEPIYRQIDLLSDHNDRLVKARDILLPKLMSGEIAV